jgi:hypothetical protein
MFDSFDPPWSDARDRGGQDELDREIYRDSRERGDDPRDALLNDFDLPRGHRRELVRARDRVYEINGAESRTLATIGAFRVVVESDLNRCLGVQRRGRRTGWPLSNGVGYGCAEGARRRAGVEVLQLDGANSRLPRGVPAHQSSMARPPARVRLAPRREERPAGAGARPPGPRVHHHDRALRQPSSRTCRPRPRVSSAGRRSIRIPENRPRRQSVKFLSRVRSMRSRASRSIACARRALTTGKIWI